MSDAFMETALVQTIATDDAEPLPTRIDLNKNYAEEPDVVDWVQSNLIAALQPIRAERQGVEEEWREVRRATLAEFDEKQRYRGRSNYYVPLWAQALNALTTQTLNGIFPSDEYINVKNRLQEEGDDKSNPLAVQDYLYFEFVKSMKLRLNMRNMVKNYWEYGHGVGKLWYQKELETVKRRELRSKYGGENFGMQPPDLFISSDTEGGRFMSRNPFYVYVWPMTADSIEEATLVFEDIDISRQTLDAQERTGRWVNVEAIKGGSIEPQHETNVQQQNIEFLKAGASATLTSIPGSDLTRFFTVTECWCNMPLPDIAYTGDESPGYPVPCKVVVANGHILEVRRNPFYFQRPPYFFARAISEAGMFYGKGTGFYAKSMQYLYNDFANQVNDNGTFALNPITLINPNLMATPPQPVAPGRVFNVLSPDAVKFDRPPIEQVQHGMSLMQYWQGVMMDTIGTPPIMQGTNAGKGARTATSSQILNRNASQPMQSVVQDFEDAIMRPLMRATWLLGQQYRTAPILSRIAGRDIKVMPQDLVGDFEFDWQASTQTANAQARASQAGQFLQAAANPVIAQLLAQQGKTLNPEPILKRMWVDGLGQRRFDEVVTEMRQPQGMPGMPGAGGTSGEAPNPLAGIAAGMTPGEGDDFSTVREGADDLAAQMGGE